MGCHGNHAFKHSQNKFFPGEIFEGMPWVPINNLTPMETFPGVARCPRVPIT